MVNICFGDMDSRTECTLNKFGVTSSCVVWSTCWREEMLDRQRHLERLERCTCENLMKFS